MHLDRKLLTRCIHQAEDRVAIGVELIRDVMDIVFVLNLDVLEVVRHHFLRSGAIC